MNAVKTFRADIPADAPPCAHCGTPCARNDYGDWVCVGDENCFLNNGLNGIKCANCGAFYEAHGFGMGNIDDRVGECMTEEDQSA